MKNKRNNIFAGYIVDTGNWQLMCVGKDKNKVISRTKEILNIILNDLIEMGIKKTDRAFRIETGMIEFVE